MNKIIEIKFGSTLYGTETPNSDLDLKGIFLPSAKQIVLQNYKKTISTQRPKLINERNNKDDIDIEYFSLDRYLQLLADGQAVALDFFFHPDNMVTYKAFGDHTFQFIKENKDKLISKDCTSYISYSRTQAAKYGVKGSRMEALKRTLEMLNGFFLHAKLGDYESDIQKLIEENKSIVNLDKTPLIQITQLLDSSKTKMVDHLEICNRKMPFGASVKFARDVLQKIYDEYGNRAHKAHLDGGKDYKALSHSVRVNSQGLELLKTGHITFPRPDAELLRDIKTRKLPFEQVSELIEQGLVDLVEAQKTSKLREKADQEWIDNFVCDVYTQIVSNQ